MVDKTTYIALKENGFYNGYTFPSWDFKKILSKLHTSATCGLHKGCTQVEWWNMAWYFILNQKCNSLFKN